MPEMLASIKTTMISKCRPVRKVQPPSENMCLVGQSSGRIKWIQPSGEQLTLQYMSWLEPLSMMFSLPTDASGWAF